MEKKTKTILGIAAIVAVIFVGVNLLNKKEEESSNFFGIFKKKKKTSNPTNVILGGTPVCVTTCEYTNKSNGSVSTYDGACNSVKANQGWATITRCSGGGSNDIMSNAE